LPKNISYEEFIGRVREAQARDPRLHRHIRSLLADNGVLAQLCNEILIQMQEAKDILASKQMVTDQDIRLGIGQQGVVRGIEQTLYVIHALMEEPDGSDSESE
jgi:hypothetical protein